MEFSKRIGKVPATKLLQIDNIDDDLKNGLWNGIKIYVVDPLLTMSQSYSEPHFRNYSKRLWHLFYKLAIDTMPDRNYEIEEYIRKRFYEDGWFKIYDLLEFIVSRNTNHFDIDIQEFKLFCNDILENEFSGYRLVDNLIVPITNEYEIAELEKAIKNTNDLTSFQGANTHLYAALKKMSDRESPDYRNSIKESISAVESMAKAISGNEKDSLGAALDKLKGKIKIHQALEKGFKQLYGYTSDSDGIRHALTETSNCDFEDAQFMLVSSSAFINYLIAKAMKAGVTLK